MELDEDEARLRLQVILDGYNALDLLIDRDSELYDEAYKQAERGALFTPEYHLAYPFALDVVNMYRKVWKGNTDFHMLLI